MDYRAHDAHHGSAAIVPLSVELELAHLRVVITLPPVRVQRCYVARRALRVWREELIRQPFITNRAKPILNFLGIAQRDEGDDLGPAESGIAAQDAKVPAGMSANLIGSPPKVP